MAIYPVDSDLQPSKQQGLMEKRLKFSLVVNNNNKENIEHFPDHSHILCFQAFESGHSDHGEGHKQNIYKSCVILAGIYVFFMVECAMKARMARRKRSQEDLHMCDEVTSPDKMVSS